MPAKIITSWFPVFDKTGNFMECKGWDVVLKHIFTVLVTIPGTRQWNPEFGCHLTDKLFDIDINESDFSNEVKNAIAKWVPYVRVNNVSVSIQRREERSGNSAKININISYNNEDRDVQFEIPQLNLLQGSIHSIKVRR